MTMVRFGAPERVCAYARMLVWGNELALGVPAMELIVTHDIADFDAVASAVAALHLYPSAQVVLARRLGRDVAAFLALHKDRLPTLSAAEADAQAKHVRKLILVDVRRLSRLGHLPRVRARLREAGCPIEVHVWDHHRATADDVRADFERVEPVGSATTLLVEELQRRGVELDVVEATLLALGVHVDTGSLRYSGTTARDAQALSWLLSRGAKLSVISRYLRPAFSRGQLRALSALIGALRIERIKGARVGLAGLPYGYVVDGLDEVTSEALALEDLHALFAAFEVRDGAVQVIGRAREAWPDIGVVMRDLGGGGHATAGSAVVRASTAQQVLSRIEGEIAAADTRPDSVYQLMSSPVHSVAPHSRVAELASWLSRWGHSGAPVMQEGRLLGIVSHKDVERALRAERTDDPVSRIMSRPVVTTTPETTLDEALSLMAAKDVGRLPVVRHKHVIGIVTRSDLITALYGEAVPTRSR